MTWFQTPVPIMIDNAARTEMTASCRDCDAIPKVDRAGEVFEHRGKAIQLMHNGVKVVAGGYYGDWMTQIIKQLRGHHEPQEELIFHEIMKYIPARATMIELGGFWSYYSLWFLANSVNRRSIVVEPDPNNLAIGVQNAELNTARIEFLQACAGHSYGDHTSFQTETAGMVSIPTVSLPYLLEEHRIEMLDILHCDTQGAETAVIESSEAMLRLKKIRFCIVSTHSHYISGDPLTHQRCLQMLQDFGGDILAEHDVHESFSGDGLIAAYFGDEDLKWQAPPLSRNRYSTSLFRNPLFDLAEIRKQ